MNETEKLIWDAYLLDADQKGQKIIIPKDYLNLLLRENEINKFINLTFAEKQEQITIHELYLINKIRIKKREFDY